MNTLEYVTVLCPYCGEKNEITIERTGAEESYTEGCQVCCCAMQVVVTPYGDDIEVSACCENT
ncbi:MAG: CPXCG motif-containing cysteine-rich protein [Mariprofundaceae bacterium]|nr:CPXCG motif-containing cysteine-rich protein [Mariprofundaceae bacterium]